VGKTLGDLVVLQPAEPRGLDRIPQGLRDHVSARLPQESEGIAIALATGDQN